VLVDVRRWITASHLLKPDSPTWEIPREGKARSQSHCTYVRLGVVHILLGRRSPPLLALLVLSLERARSVLLAETAFTLAHTVSFAATALGMVRVSPVAAEACIALSLVLVACDVKARVHAGCATVAIVRGARVRVRSRSRLGFAGGLREVGLPERDVGWALAGFGLGVEIGQVAFLVVVLAALRAMRRARWYPRAAVGASYVIGVVASYWLVERVMACIRAA